MLDGLRIMSKNVFGRVILAIFAGLIVVGFGFFGIRDVFNNFRAGQLATVGDVDIGVQQYRVEYQNELQRVQRQAKRAITNDEARQAGLDRQVLSRIITGVALDQEAKKLGLAASDAEIAKGIKSDRNFFGPNGVFDQARFDELLRENGYTETMFVREQREGAMRQQIGVAATGAIKTPEIMLAAINTFTNETRKADYFILPAPGVSQAAVPADDEIQSFYNLRKDSYRTPEYRKTEILTVTPEQIAQTLAISDQAARATYDRDAAQRFSAPEKRAVSQLTFPDRDSADKAAQRIAGGESFDAVAGDKQARGVLADLGVSAKAAIFDKAVADAAFALPQPGVSAPIQGQFGWVLARVAKIEPGQLKSFDEVKAQIKAEIAASQAKGEARKLHDKIEDLRSSGKTLAQAAQELGLQTQIFVTDAAGAGKAVNGQPGAPIAALAGSPELVKAVFASDVGVDNDSVSRKDGGFSWFEIGAIEPSRVPPLDEVKAAVIRSLQESQAQRDLAAKANELARKIDAGESLAALAAANGVKPQQALGFKRSGGDGLSEAAVSQMFGVPVGAAGVAIADKGGRYVFKVTDAVTPPLNLKDPDIAALAPRLDAALNEDVFGQFIAGLETQLGAKVNQAVLRSATGADQ
jgi:peptidyl-prolyl cis-trans isomerase D